MIPIIHSAALRACAIPGSRFAAFFSVGDGGQPIPERGHPESLLLSPTGKNMSFLLRPDASADDSRCQPSTFEERPVAHGRAPVFVNHKHLWCQIIADTLADMSVASIVMHSGARNVPLVLGLTAATGAPMVVSISAGSAVAACRTGRRPKRCRRRDTPATHRSNTQRVRPSIKP